MNSPIHAVARGLRNADLGFLIAGWGATSALGIGWIWDKIYYHDYLTRIALLVVLVLAILAGLAGVVVGFIGRVRCLRMPEEFPIVRGRAMVAVVLEGSGWASLVVGVGVFFALGFGGFFPGALWISGVGALLSGLSLLGGRILFLMFLRALAAEVEDITSYRRARLSFALFLSQWAVALIALGISMAGGALGINQLTTPIIVLTLAAGMSGLAGMILYDRLLGGLAKSVQAFAETHAEHDEESEEESNEG